MAFRNPPLPGWMRAAALAAATRWVGSAGSAGVCEAPGIGSSWPGSGKGVGRATTSIGLAGSGSLTAATGGGSS